jgi:predicted phage terminase large subunit-like protein
MNKPPVDPVAAAEYLLKLREAQETFLGFVKFMFPDFITPDFHYEIIEALDALERGTLGKKKLMLNMPVRHGKTWLLSTCFPVYYMGCKPNRKILMSSYSAELATTIGKDVRNLVQEPKLPQIFPELELDKTSQAANDWRTTKGGKFYACGIGGSTSGRPANLLLWDDLLKNRESADSPTQRNAAWSHYVSALSKRLEPEVDNTPAIEIGVMTRWHPDDPCGRIIDGPDYKEGDWHHIVMPGLRTEKSSVLVDKRTLPPQDPNFVSPKDAESLNEDELMFYPDEEKALWPHRFPVEYLKKQQRLDPSEFSALFQQEPFVKGGNIIKETWWQIYTKEEAEQKYASIIIAVDTAFKAKEQNDFSVFMTLGLTQEGDMHIMNIKRERLEYPELKRQAITQSSLWRGRGLRGMYIEDQASGQSLIQDLRQERGISVIPVKINRDKVARLNTVAPLIEGGRVFIPEEAPWLDEFLTETQAFPNSKHDDQVDALTIGLDALSRFGSTNLDLINTPLEMSASLFNQFENEYSNLGDLNQLCDSKGIRAWGE